MTIKAIDEAIDIMERYEMYGFNSQKDGRNKAIEIMRKYQKIEDIYYHQSGEALENSLRAVIEDGDDKIDCKHTDCNNCVNHKYCDYEPTTKNNLEVDCISRHLAIERMKKDVKDIEKLEGSEYITIDRLKEKLLEDSITILRALPPATPQEPRKGHWIGIDEEPHEDWECDNCGFVIWADENIEKFHYCPNCGAKMEQGENT